MRTPTQQELSYVPTEEQVRTTIARIGSTGKVRRSIPVQVDDDDIVLDNLFEDWKRLRKAHELPGAGGGERTGPEDDAAQAGAAGGMEAARSGGTAGDATGAAIAGEMAPAGPAAQVVEFRHEPWQAFRALGPIDTARALYLAINFDRHTIYRDDFRWVVDSLLASRDESAVAVKAAQEERDARLAAESALRRARDTCDGSCDISLARRQVGPDAIVPGNAKECAELWEREASRLAAEGREWRRGVEDANRIAQEHDRARQAAEERLAKVEQAYARDRAAFWGEVPDGPPVTMAEIDEARAQAEARLERARQTRGWMGDRFLADEEVVVARAKVDTLLVRWWAQGCREVAP